MLLRNDLLLFSMILFTMTSCRAETSMPPSEDVLVFLPGGQFVDGDGASHQVQNLYIDETEVTVEAYRRCIGAGHCSAAIGILSSEFEACVQSHECRKSQQWKVCNFHQSGRAKHPMNCVGIGHALQFCAWRGMRLPDQWEWEWAARGGAAVRRFPWGEDLPTCDLAAMAQHSAEGASFGCGRNSTSPVGSKPRGASAHGVLDLAGNVREFVVAEQARRFDVRGGAFVDDMAEHFAVAARRPPVEFFKEFPFSGADLETGFRCVK